MINTTKNPIDKLFERLGATYGATWDRSLGKTPLVDVKTIWAHELSYYLSSKQAMKSIAWALENLTEKCPNVIEFKNLCRQAPAQEVPRLPEPKADPERLKAEIAKINVKPAQETVGEVNGVKYEIKNDGRDWARKILARKEAGEKISPTVLQMAKDGLKFC